MKPYPISIEETKGISLILSFMTKEEISLIHIIDNHLQDLGYELTSRSKLNKESVNYILTYMHIEKTLDDYLEDINALIEKADEPERFENLYYNVIERGAYAWITGAEEMLEKIS